MSAPVTAYHAGFNDLSLTPVSPSCPSDLLQAGRPVNFYQTPLSWSANKNLGGRFIQVSEAQLSTALCLHPALQLRSEHQPLRPTTGGARDRALGPEKETGAQALGFCLHTGHWRGSHLRLQFPLPLALVYYGLSSQPRASTALAILHMSI